MLSKPQLNNNSTQPNTTLFGLDTKIALYTHHPAQHKLNVSNISAVSDGFKKKNYESYYRSARLQV